MTLSCHKKINERCVSSATVTPLQKNPMTPQQDDVIRSNVKKFCSEHVTNRVCETGCGAGAPLASDVTPKSEQIDGALPPRGCEVFVSRIPKTITETELRKLFNEVGTVFEIRLMMETKEMNKGYAFVRFFSRDEADRSVDKLNNYEIRDGVRLSVVRSIDNNRIFIGNVPRTFTQDDIWDNLINLTPGISKIILYPDINDRNKNRGYGFVEFERHQQAATARQRLIGEPLVWCSQEIKVDWAEPLIEVDDETMRKVKILYVRNLSLMTTEQQILDLFSSMGGQIDRVRKLKDYAFVHFATRDQAEKAKAHFQGHLLDGCEMDISWSKPVTNREEYQQRKAMSKLMLSKASACNPSPAIAAAITVQGDPIFLNPRVRNAAGSHGFPSSKAYVGQTNRPAEMFLPKIPAQQNMFVPAQYYPTVSTMKPHSSVEAYGVSPSIQPVYTSLERSPSSEDIPGQEEIQLPYAAGALNGAPFSAPPAAAPAQWAQVPILLPQQLMYTYNAGLPQVPTAPHANIASAPAAPTYYYQQPAAATAVPQATVMNNAHFGQMPYTQFFQSPVMTHITNIGTSTMGIDRQ